jgi:hypothetical protein
MSDPADKLAAQGPIVTSRAERQVQFISDALRAGELAILVSGRDPFSARVPDAALAACVSTSVTVLHIGRPLPEPLELQEMIGAAAGIAGSREMEPEAMARRLVTADPRQAVVLAIDDADTLPRQSLCYLALMSDLLALKWPALQIVFAAGPALLKTLTRPEFETFRNRVTFAGELIEPLRASANTPSIAPQSVELPPMVLAQWRLGRLLGAIAHAAPAVVVIAMSCLVIIGYLAFLAFPDDPRQSPAPAVKSGALQEFAGGAGPSLSAPPLDPRRTDEVIAALIDKAETAIAQGSFGSGPDNDVGMLLDRVGTLAANASPVGRKLVMGIPERFSADALAAAAAGRIEEARRLEQFSHFRVIAPPTAPAGFAGANPKDAPPQQAETALAQAVLPRSSAPPAGQRDAADETDRPILFPKVAAPAALDALPDQPVAATPQAQVAMVLNGAAPVAADLPALAPIRVVLTFARDNAARVERAAAIRQSLVGTAVEVADLDTVDAQGPRPGIGYYFRSDHDAAVGVSRRLERLLGAVEPVVLPLRGRVPSPGTIEIAIP